MKRTPLETLSLIAQVIYDKKGANILALDVRDYSNITDYMLIAEGQVDRHVTAIAKAIVDEMREKGETPLHVEGMKSGDWIVLDFVEVTVHLFIPNVRHKYALEKLWVDSKIVDLNIDVSKSAVSYE